MKKFFFFLQNFSPNRNWRKNRIPLFDFLLIGIERPMNIDTKKILLTFVVMSKFARKNFFFSSKFFDQSEFEKNEIHLFDFLLVRFERPMNTDAKKILLTSVVLSKSARKIIFSSKFFDQSDFEKNETQFFNFFLIGIERSMNTDVKKIPLTVFVLSKSARKNFFFYQNFSTNQNFRKNKFQFFQFFSIGIPRPVDTDAKKIQLTSVVFSKSARKNFFFSWKFFRSSRIHGKIKFNYSIFFSLESRNQ